MSTAPCVFCDIVQGEADASLVYEDELTVAFMDRQPVNDGHVLVIPRTHAAYLAELAPDTGGHLFQVGMKVADALRHGAVRCEGVNFVLADGSAAGQEVFHVHLHVIPRFGGDGFGFRFSPNYHDLPGRDRLDETADRIRQHLVMPGGLRADGV